MTSNKYVFLKQTNYFNLKKGAIISFSETDSIKVDGFEIEVIPAFKYLLD